MLIVDAQGHIWGSGKPTNVAHRQVPVFSRDKELIMGRALRTWTDWRLPG